MKRRADLQAAYEVSGLPKGFRHEFASVEMAKGLGELERYLVGTHHGYGRPWVPVCEDGKALGAQYARLDGGWAQLYVSLLERFGVWALAEMETILRVADIRRTIEEQERG